jgi:hypothetical protein
VAEALEFSTLWDVNGMSWVTLWYKVLLLIVSGCGGGDKYVGGGCGCGGGCGGAWELWACGAGVPDGKALGFIAGLVTVVPVLVTVLVMVVLVVVMVVVVVVVVGSEVLVVVT